MIEILAIVALSRRIKKIVTAKGLKPGKYIGILVALWIGMEVLGFLIGGALFGESLLIVVFGLAGAAIGGLLAFQIANNAKGENIAIDEFGTDMENND